MNSNQKFVTGFFYTHTFALDNENSSLPHAPQWGMSLRAAGSMRFRWNETNQNRISFLQSIAHHHTVAQIELIHSHTVYAVDSADELLEKQGDGIITTDRNLLPVVTVADCMPIFLYEQKTGVFGVLHSGWKGTGIVRDAIEKAEKAYGAKRENFCVVMGPHIHDCCYTIDEERAHYFSVNFSPDCVTPVEPSEGIIFAGDVKNGGPVAVQRTSGEKKFRLSLAKANLAVWRDMGVPEDNIVVCSDCTCCNPLFGSFRRETLGLPADMPLNERQKHFTVQAAWVK